MPKDRARIEREKVTIGKMVALQCSGRRHTEDGLCDDCGVLLRYAHERIDNCPHHATDKPVCGLCRANCFSPGMHGLFLRVMRYAGPRMMLRHPFLTAAHFRDALRRQKPVG